MKLGLFTPVFGNLTVEEMLAKVRALEEGRRRSSSAPAAGPAAITSTSTRCSTTTRARRVPADDRRRGPDDQRAVVPRQPAASRPRDRAGLRRRVPEDGAAGRTAGGAGRRDLLGLPRRLRRRASIRTGSRRRGRRSFSRCSTGSGRRRRFPYWTGAASFAADHGVKVALEAASGLPRLQRRHGAEAARAPPARTSASTSIRAISSGRASTCRRRSARSATSSSTCTPRTSPSIAQNVAVNGVIDTKSYRRLAERSWLFRTVGWGHDELEWKRIVSALRLAGYDYVMSIEHEDALASVDEGLRSAVDLLSPRDPDRAAGRRVVDVGGQRGSG